MQDFLSVDAIAERDLVEFDVAADRRQPRAPGRIGRLGRGVENVAQPQDRQACLVKVLPYLRETEHRRAHPASQDVEGHQLADRQAAVDDELGTEIEEAGGDDLADELHHLARGVAETEDPETRRYVTGELFFPAALHLRLDRHGLERLDTGHALDQKRLVLSAALELLVQPPPEQRRRRRRDRDVKRERAEYDRSQQRRVEEHDRQEHEGEEQVDDEGQGRAGEKIADVLQFAHPRHRIADAPRLKVAHRQSQQVAEQARAELDVDAVGGVREQIGAQDGQNGLENRDRQQTDDQHVQRAQGPVHQHLVDDHLEEQRRDEREQLQEERRDQHLAQEMAIFVDRAKKPGDVESEGDICNYSQAGRETQLGVAYAA